MLNNIIQAGSKNVAIIVAHPDDETLWAGGTILDNPTWNCFILCLCRKSDHERAAKFSKALGKLSANGIMGDLDDGPFQTPLSHHEVEDTILELLPSMHFDILITHNLAGEYTRHLRHEEVSKAVVNLLRSGKILVNEFWTFAYEDGNKRYYPKAMEKGASCYTLPEAIWKEKYDIITKTYGFRSNSWEARTTPRIEAFIKFADLSDLKFNF